MMFYDFIKNILVYFSSECYFKVHWNIYCPGCGGTRALLALIRGDVVQSMKYNPIVLLFLMDVLGTTTLCIIENKNKKYSTARWRMIIHIVFLIFILAFFLVRNLMLYGFGIDVLGDFSG